MRNGAVPRERGCENLGMTPNAGQRTDILVSLTHYDPIITFIQRLTISRVEGSVEVL